MSGLLDELSSFLPECPATAQEQLAFYGVVIFSTALWCAGQPWTLGAFILVFAIVVSALAILYGLLGAYKETIAVSLATRMLPAVLGLAWLGLAFLPEALSIEQLLAFVVLGFLLLLLIPPFGSTIGLSFAMPVMLALNQALWKTDLAAYGYIFVVLNVCFIVYLLSTLKAMNTGVDERSGNIQILRKENDRLRLAIESQGASLDYGGSEQTQALQDANRQLSEQIALRKTISDALVKSQTRLTQAIEASHLGLIDWDIAQGRFYQSSFHQFYGDKEQSSQQIIETLKRVIHPADYALVRDTLNACLAGEQLEYQIQYRVQDDSSWRWIEECCKVVDTTTQGHASRVLGTRRDIHSEVQRDEQVRLAKSVFDHTSEGVFVLDREGKFLSSNPAYTEITGQKPEQIDGRLINEISQTPQTDQVFAQIFDALEADGRWQGEILEKRWEGDYFPQWTQINAIHDELGGIKYYAGLVSDLSDRKAADEKLDYLLNYDDLTKLANRVQFQNQLHRALVRFQNEGLPFALVHIDIDRFKHFNDSFGHAASDALLEQVAQRLATNVQRVDILARVGGNEFACIVACSPTFSVKKFAQRLFKIITHKQYEVSGNEVVLSCRMGIAMVPEHTQDIESLIRCASLAVQKAKYQGGNQILVFNESLKYFSKERLEIEKELRHALQNDELEVFYQPKFDLNQERITSYEALVRWQHPVRGLISPDEFVAIAEENGLIEDLGSYVLESACRQTQAWQDAGLGRLNVSVNLAPRQLQDEQLKSVIERCLEKTKLSPSQLELELTESAIMEDMQGVANLLSSLREIGLKVSVDDFGTGYSSLSYLRSLPVDALKIDREFVENMEHSVEQQAIVKAILVLGDSLGLQVVAEGVENDEQMRLLKILGCDLVQGYFVSKPVNAQKMEGLLTAQLDEVL